MNDYKSLSHTKWDCRYHVVFIPKYRRKTLYVELRRHLEEVFHKLPLQKESRIKEGHLMADHVHMMISIPPKYAVSQVIGFIKGKSANWNRRSSTKCALATQSTTAWAIHLDYSEDVLVNSALMVSFRPSSRSLLRAALNSRTAFAFWPIAA